MSIDLKIFIFFAGIILLIICFEIISYFKLKNQVEKPIKKTIHTEYLIKEDEATKLIKAYSHIFKDPGVDVKGIILKLKFLNETKGKNQGLEDIFKMITSTVPLVAIVVTVFVAQFKNIDDLSILSDFGDMVLKFSTTFVIIIAFATLYNVISNTSTSKTKILISKHLLIAEEIHKELATVKSSDDINNPDNTKSD